jgi:hypothetical protein
MSLPPVFPITPLQAMDHLGVAVFAASGVLAAGPTSPGNRAVSGARGRTGSIRR